ncbi:MAG TPA: hypothetical protein VKU41_26510, partial [Polyangiaceae bacterium]|nr:hypothetical protein [Polyangiaceae bacterium]
MPELKKAQLTEMVVDATGKFNPKDGGMSVSVQFNPESLKVTYNNQVRWPGPGDQNGTAAIQFVGMGTTKLSVTLWFDSTAATTTGEEPTVSQPSSDTTTALATSTGAQITDVRSITEDVAYFIEPDIPSASAPANTRSTKARAVRFQWGTFYFDGVMDTMEENIEFFAPDGTPIRSS